MKSLNSYILKKICSGTKAAHQTVLQDGKRFNELRIYNTCFYKNTEHLTESWYVKI